MAGLETAKLTYSIAPTLPTTTGLPPLTTTFNYAPSCQHKWVVVDSTKLSSGVGMGDWYTSCQASKVSPTYSPGICPDDHEIVRITEWRTKAGITSGEQRFWHATCCPSGFDIAYDCYSDISTPITAYEMVRDSDSKVLSLATGTRTVLTRGGLYADAIVVIWQNKDFSLFDSDYVSALVSKLPLDMVSSATTRSLHVVTTMGAKDEDEESLASTPITSQGSKSFHKDDAYLPVEGGKPGLSKGAKAGIAFGILFLVIGVAVVIVVVMRYRKRQKYVPKPAEGARQQNLPELVEARNNVRRGEDVKRAASA